MEGDITDAQIDAIWEAGPYVVRRAADRPGFEVVRMEMPMAVKDVEHCGYFAEPEDAWKHQRRLHVRHALRRTYADGR